MTETERFVGNAKIRIINVSSVLQIVFKVLLIVFLKKLYIISFIFHLVTLDPRVRL